MRFAGPRGKGLELEPYGIDSSQADGVIVDEWYLSREKERKPYMVADGGNHNCTHTNSFSDCPCLEHMVCGPITVIRHVMRGMTTVITATTAATPLNTGPGAAVCRIPV